jgi:hypothetical protein
MSLMPNGLHTYKIHKQLYQIFPHSIILLDFIPYVIKKTVPTEMDFIYSLIVYCIQNSSVKKSKQ